MASLGDPGLVGVGHDRRSRPHGLDQRPQAVQIPLQVGVADLDLEGLESLLLRCLEESAVLRVGHVVVQPAGVGAHAVARAAQEAVEGQAQLLAL